VKLIYTNENRFLVGNARNIVENSGIAVTLKNEYAAGGIGELSPFDSWPELWVLDDSDYEAAVRLIASVTDPKSREQWVCNNCAETNDASFEFCWNCRSEKT